MQHAHMHNLFHFLLDILFPKNGGPRPLRQNDMTILDFLMSDHFKNAVLRSIRIEPNFLGGSTYFTAELEKLKEERREAKMNKRRTFREMLGLKADDDQEEEEEEKKEEKKREEKAYASGVSVVIEGL